MISVVIAGEDNVTGLSKDDMVYANIDVVVVVVIVAFNASSAPIKVITNCHIFHYAVLLSCRCWYIYGC